MGLVYSLEKEGYEVKRARNAKEAEAELPHIDDYALCVLDVNLPDGNGYDICKKIKAKSKTPVIFLTAFDDEVNVVMGLEIGADDYICKPFRLKELTARIKTVLRRTGAGDGNTINTGDSITLGNGKIKILPAEAKVLKDGKDLELTAMEYRLLLNFINNRGIVLSRNKLLEDMWDVEGDFVNDNTLTVYIKRLRDKIEDNPSDPTIIKTVRGMGYILEKE